MAEFELNILGCGSAMPTRRHNPSSQVVNHRGRLFMVDCGEGAQLEFRRQGLKFSRLGHIFISHLHGDHCLGLPGLLSTMALYENGTTVTIHTHAEGARFFADALRFCCGDSASFDVKFNILSPGHTGIIYEDPSLTVETFPLHHRMPCAGFIFRGKANPRHIDGDAVRFHAVPHYFYEALRRGEDFTAPDGSVIANSRLTTPADPASSYAYCCDTQFDRAVARAAEGVDTIYHDATYTDEHAHLAGERGHTTARGAGQIATLAGAKRLILGHFSKRYADESVHRKEAAEVFGGKIITANEGMKINLQP